MRYLSSLLFLWICLVGCELSVAGTPAAALPDQITPAATKFLAAPILISPAAMLDAEKYLLHAETVVKLSDSLWLTVQAMADSQNKEAIDTGHLSKLVNQGLKTLGENLKWLPEVRRIERHLSEITSSDYQFIVRALYQQAIYDYFDAKEKNPYNNQVGAAIFHKLLTKFWRERHVSAEVIDAFWEKSQSTKWLEAEKYDYYLLIGAIHHYFRRWPEALAAYTQAYELNTRHAYPPGIDSSFAARQDSIASKAMISSERKLIAQVIMEDAMEIKVIHDSLRFYNNYFLDPLNVFTYADSQMARRFFDRALTFIDMNDRFLQKRIKKAIMRKYNLMPEDLEFIADQLFPTIERKFLKAKEFDPFNWSHRYRLARLLYYNLAEVTGDSTYYAKSAAEFENLIWIQKGNWGYYLYLGDAYMGMHAWEQAYQNYHQAEIVLVNTALLNQSDPQIFFARPDSSPVEPNWLTLCINHQAEAKIKMLEGKTALDLLRRAVTITTDEKMREQLNLRIDDVNWDEGNVVAMNLRHQAIAYNREGKYDAAKAIYLHLLTLLWTQKTRDEINSQIAIYDFQYLDQKEAGIERMRQVVAPIAKDENGEAVNPENNVYLRHYGRMCYELGLKYLQQEEDRKLAYIYFAQSTQIKWSGRPKAFLQLADLSNFDPRETIRLCNTALAEPESLSPGDKRQLAELLSKSFQKQANFIEAKTWHRRSLDKQWCENRTSY